jgi:lambda family phage portal protein
MSPAAPFQRLRRAWGAAVSELRGMTPASAPRPRDVGPRVVPPTMPQTRAAFRAAAVSRLDLDWRPSLVSPDDEIRGVLRLLRGRARELSNSEPMVGQYLNLLSANVLGPDGIQLLAVNGPDGEIDDEATEIIRDGWEAWWNGPVTADEQMNGPMFEALQLETTATDGESFSRMLVGRDFRDALALEPIDADLVPDGLNRSAGFSAPEIRLGVQVDERGRRTGYWIHELSSYSPGSQMGRPYMIPGDEIIHAYRPRRGNQTRGISWLTRAMMMLNHGGRFLEAGVIGARVGASQMGFIKWKDESLAPATTDPSTEGATTEGGGGGEGTGSSSSQRPEIEVEPGTFPELDPGQEFQEWSPQYPNTTTGEFMKVIDQRTASGLGAQYHSLANNLEGVNYSSMRGGELFQRDLWRMLQQIWIFSFRRRIYERWLQTAMLAGRIQLPSQDWRRYINVTWQPRGYDWVDPKNDLEAEELELKLGGTSLTEILASKGRNLRTIISQRKREKEMFEKAGLALPEHLRDAPTPAPDGPPAGAKNEPPPADDDAPTNGNGNGKSINRLLAAGH